VDPEEAGSPGTTVCGEVSVMRRFGTFLSMVLALTISMYLAWVLARIILPQELLRSYFTRLFSLRMGKMSIPGILLANIVPFGAVVFMNLFKGKRLPGGALVIPIFWILYGLILGTNSFVYQGQPVNISIDVLWKRSGFTELLAYTAGFEASRRWALWKGFFRSERIRGARWKPNWQDWIYLGMGLALLAISAVRETLA
jgi:hypothetical protein